MIIASYVLAGVLSALFFVDTFLTLDGVHHSNGLIEEKTKYMRWFVQSPWRAYPLTLLECVAVVAIVRITDNLDTKAWFLSALFCLGLIIHRTYVVINNYVLNIHFVVEE